MSSSNGENTKVADPEDDVVVVQDQTVDEDKVHDELVADVTKLLEQPEPEKPSESEKPPVGDSPKGEKVEKTEKPPKGEGAEDEGLSQDLQTRAKGAGLTDDLAQSLHQAGQLEETLAAFDRGLIEHFQSKESSEDESEETPKGRREKEPPPKVSADAVSADAEIPALDPDVYDEDLVKRDAYQQKRIDTLEQQLSALHSQIEELVEGQQGGFDDWFDGILTDLGCDTTDDDKCQSVFKAYGAMCAAFGENHHARNRAMVERAYAAMYPQDVFKEKQRQTVTRLRDAQGKFLSSPTSKGGPPPKGTTDEEVQSQLVSDVTAYLKEQGVQMSGV